jgi:hypothetical protein
MTTTGTVANAAAKRQIVRDADVVVDDVADELRGGEQLGGDEVPERQREGEDGAGDHRRQRERQHDAPEGQPRPRAEVADASSIELGSRSRPA